MIFLIHYDRSAGETRELLEFTEHIAASKAKLSMEISLIGQKNGHEVVLLEAENKADLMKTHSRYFSNLRDIKIQE